MASKTRSKEASHECQDMLDTKLMILAPIEMQVIAGFLKGEQVEEEV